MLTTPFDGLGKLRLQSNGTKVLIDPRTVGIIGRGSRGELNQAVKGCWYSSHRDSVASSRGTGGETGLLYQVWLGEF